MTNTAQAIKLSPVKKKVFVNRYKTSHMNRRKQLRRAKKDGVASVIEENGDGWLYEIPDSFRVKQG